MKLALTVTTSLTALAIATSAFASDVTAQTVALDTCNVLGVSGLTLSSDDTCLSISGIVEYAFEYEIDGATGVGTPSSEVDWELQFEAITQSDIGAASAVLVFTPEDPAVVGGPIIVDEAYVTIGDTTVLTAGLAPTMMPQVGRDQYILSNLSVSRPGGHVIQLESLIAEGLVAGIALEDLEDDGTLAGFIEYEGDSIEATAGGLVYNIYDIIDLGAAAEWALYADLLIEYDTTEFFAAFVAENDELEFVSSVGVELDDLLLKSAYGFAYDWPTNVFEHAFGIGFEKGPIDFEIEFITLDFADLGINVDVAYELNADMEAELELAFEDVTTHADIEGTLTLTTELTETLELETWAGLEYVAATTTTLFGGGTEITYEPGGGFETSASLEGWSNGDLIVGFSAEKEF
ncbi:hypothetical protein [Pelagibacterium halotolerans]|uniref:Porin n=1 Tax=Pelagibacterium halotolerans (strain DSM 22347 / JCM 15775 / CGMCC 1.7692 / B2) TaxID=1082931 RepID=G4R6M3_PELHB|nr:hypothetical protein [Pelagibacterium halotolerans]AEQ51219.1 hypothetical protein KKY_1189 [Pelagibacterium halotolerans B2]QJR18918.1 hypothetical protein HKM20_10985 [Pelagibacterium halotolerans]SEA68028.1 hypothetical protein SAMN05428936_106102 [Pelagibacterium halotolerans]